MAAPGRRILIVGQTGAGKSSITNVLYNESVEIEHMKTPADTSYAAGGVTLSTKTYIQNAKELIVDTVGFSDNADQTQAQFIQDLRDVFHQTRMSFTHVLFVIPFDRISRATKSALALLRTLFGDSWAQVIVVITKCDTSRQTIQEFFKINKNSEDAKPIFELVKNVFSRSDGARVLTGSFLYEDDQSVDESRGFKSARVLFKEQLISCLHHNPSVIKTIPVTFSEFFKTFLDFFCNLVGLATNTGHLIYDTVVALAANATKYNVKHCVYLPMCSICLDDVYTEQRSAAYNIKCGHIYHHECIVIAVYTRPVCPNCNEVCNHNDLVLFSAGLVGADLDDV